MDLGVGTGSLAFGAMELSPPKQMIGVDFSYPGLCAARGISGRTRFWDMDFEAGNGGKQCLLAGECTRVY